MASLMTLSAQDEVSGSATVAWESAYVFRGAQFGEESIQPAFDIAIGDFYAGVWGALDLGSGDEIDYYAGYGFAATEMISIDVGVTYYTYPNSEDFENGGTVEAYLGAAFDAMLEPSVYVYYDFDLEVFTIEGGLGHSVELSEAWSLGLGGSVGFASGDDIEDYTYYLATADFSYALTETASVGIGVRWSGSTEDLIFDQFEDPDPDSSLFWWGLSASVGF